MRKFLLLLLLMVAPLYSQTTPHDYTAIAGGLRPPPLSNTFYEPFIALCSNTSTVVINQVRVSGDMLPGHAAGDGQLILARRAGLDPTAAPTVSRPAFRVLSSDPAPVANEVIYLTATPLYSDELSLHGYDYLAMQTVSLNGTTLVLYHKDSPTSGITLLPGECAYIVMDDVDVNLNYFTVDWEFTAFQ